MMGTLLRFLYQRAQTIYVALCAFALVERACLWREILVVRDTAFRIYACTSFEIFSPGFDTQGVERL